MKKRIFLDDIRAPIDSDWVIVRNYDEFDKNIKRDIDEFSKLFILEANIYTITLCENPLRIIGLFNLNKR